LSFSFSAVTLDRMDDVVRALEKNFIFQIGYFADFIPIMRIIKNDAIIKITKIQDDTFNIVLNARFTNENADDKIKEIINLFKKSKLPFSWWVGQNDSPADLKEKLIFNGFTPKEYDYGMYMKLKTYTPKKIETINVKQVSNAEEMKEFDNVHVKSFGSPNAYDLLLKYVPPYAYKDKSPYRFYTGYSNNKAVTTGVLVFHAGVVGIYYIVTLPEERRKGYATKMMHYLLDMAHKENQNTIILQASEAGKKVYEKIGFIKCCVFQEFVK
jgi:GNAT superfamily N-acetyltransferase